MKAYTDLKQSKKLAEILPLESADMTWVSLFDLDHITSKYSISLIPYSIYSGVGVPCWSLTALLNVLPSSTLDSSDDHHYRLHCIERFTEWYDNSVDACYEMILKLHEQNLL